MSARRIRKLKQLNSVGTEEDASADELESPQENFEDRNANKFSFFLDDDDDDEDEDDDDNADDVVSSDISRVEDAKAGAHAAETSDGRATEDTSKDASPSPVASKKKKRRRKKKKSKKSAASETASAFSNGVDASARNDKSGGGDLPTGEEKFDESISSQGALFDRSLESLFTSNPREFNSEYEMSKIFGKDVVFGEEKSSRERDRRTRQRLTGGGRTSTRNTVLARVDADYIPLEVIPNEHRNITMSMVTSKNGVKWFKWVFSEDYQIAEEEYQVRVRTYDHQQLIDMLQEFPYHINTLLQVSEILKQHGEIAEAGRCIERAIYRFEFSFHPSFSYLKGNCRMSYDEPDNRSFYLTLYRHIQFLGRRGCPRTALAFSKLLLGLDPENDPMCVLLSLGYYAVRAKEYDFLREFASKFRQNGHSVRVLPNFAFSLALSEWYRCERPMDFDDISSFQCTLDELDPSSMSASRCLSQAILMFPEVIAPLLSKANSKLLKTGRWKRIFESRHFIDGKIRRENNAAIEKLVSIFVERSHALWEHEKTLEWLAKHCESVVKSLAVSPDATESKSAEPATLPVKHYKSFSSARDAVYEDSKTPSRYARLDVSDFSDVVTTLPADELPAPIRPQTPPGLQVNMQNMNPVAGLLLSLLPWVTPGGQMRLPDAVVREAQQRMQQQGDQNPFGGGQDGNDNDDDANAL